MRAGRPAEAEPVFRRVADEASRIHADGPRLRATALAELAAALVLLNRSAEARAVLESIEPPHPAGSLAADKLLFQMRMILGESYRYEKQSPRAEQPFREALAAANRHPAEMNEHVVDVSMRLTDVLDASRAREAVVVLEAALALAEANRSTRAARIASALVAAYGSLKGDAHATARADELWARYAGVAREIDGATLELRDITIAELRAPDPRSTAARSALAPAKTSGDAASTEPTLSNAAQVVAAMRDDFRSCYQKLLDEQHDAQGQVRLTIAVGASGAVNRARAGALGLPASTVDCILRRAAQGKFDAPAGGGAIVNVPINLVKQ
jgi:tetratricopeptide (TPR) repeat protein